MRARRVVAAAKINLALVVGPRRDDGLHEVATVLQRIDVCDRVELESAERLAVEGFRDDTIVRRCMVVSFCFGGRVVDAVGLGRLRNNLVAKRSSAL